MTERLCHSVSMGDDAVIKFNPGSWEPIIQDLRPFITAEERDEACRAIDPLYEWAASRADMRDTLRRLDQESWVLPPLLEHILASLASTHSSADITLEEVSISKRR